MAEFGHFKSEAGLPTFVLSPKQWTEKTAAIGIISKSGRYGGTYAHRDIAFEFGAAISATFKLYLIKEIVKTTIYIQNPPQIGKIEELLTERKLEYRFLIFRY